MRRILLPCLLGVVFTAVGIAQPLERDLGRGLVYVRAQTLPADLPARSTAPALVLDLRYASGDATGLTKWIRAHASRQAPVFILANAETQPALLPPNKSAPGVIILGPASANFHPDIAITVTPEQEKRAYDAIPGAESIETLFKVPTEKSRYDEAAVVKARNEGREWEPEPLPKDDAPTKTDEPTPLIDFTLQRAVQIHRGWLVLRSR